jgi:hypothetical protein
MVRGERHVLAHDEDAPCEERVDLRLELRVSGRLLESRAVERERGAAVSRVVVEPRAAHECAGVKGAGRCGAAGHFQQRPRPGRVPRDEVEPAGVDRAAAALDDVVVGREQVCLLEQLGGGR